MKGHYLKTRLVDHCLVNNKVMLGQETQYTYQSTKVWLKQSKSSGLEAMKAVEVLPWLTP